MTAGSSADCDAGIRDGRISQIGGSPRGRCELDARSALVLPGGLELPVRLSSPEPPHPGVPARADDFASGSRAAIAGGVTTSGNMTFPGDGQSLREALDRDQADARDSAAADYVLHPVVDSPSPPPRQTISTPILRGYSCNRFQHRAATAQRLFPS